MANQVVRAEDLSPSPAGTRNAVTPGLAEANGRQAMCGDVWWNPARAEAAGQPRRTQSLCFTTYQIANFQSGILGERVIVTGTRTPTTGWVTLCVREACRDVMGELNREMWAGEVGFWKTVKEEVIEFLKPMKPVWACHPGVSIAGRNTTSEASDIDRVVAASAIIIGHIGAANTLTSGLQKYKVTYSDDGTQSYWHNTGDPAAPIPVDDLVIGTGKSKCPSNS